MFAKADLYGGKKITNPTQIHMIIKKRRYTYYSIYNLIILFNFSKYLHFYNF